MTQVKPKRAKILPLEDIYVRASRVELKCSSEGASSSQMEFFGTTHCPNPKTTSVAACAVPVKDYSHVPLGQPKSGVQVFHTPQKQKQAIDTIVCYDEGGTSNSRTSIRVSEDYVPNPPALSAAWKGRFEIHNYSQGLYLQAHPPEKVWCKAYKVLKQTPELVHLTLQSRHDVWPDTFKIDPPSVTDIALYFWADDFCRSSDTYNQLLHYMEKKDLSLRSRVDSVELFVFTSKQLPVEYQRLNRQSYLWGVFQPLRGKQLSGGLLTMPHLRIGEDFMKVTDKDDDQAVDMEIDMIGGEEVGRVDEYRSKTEFMPRLDMASLYVVSEIQSGQPAQGCNRAKHHYQVKSEHCQDVGTSPRFSTSVVAPGSLDVVRKSSVDWQTKKVKCEQCDDSEAPGFLKSFGAPGSSRLVTSGTGDKGLGAASVVKISPAACKMDAPPGFSKLLKLRDSDSSSEIKREQFDDVSTPGFSKLVDSPIPLRPITTDAANEVSSTISQTKMTPVNRKVDAHPDFRKLLELRNTSSQVKREQCDGINAPTVSSSAKSSGSVRQVGSDAADKAPSTTSAAMISPGTCQVDAPPGFSKSLEPKDKNTSFKVKREQCDLISTTPGLIRPSISDATNMVPSTICLTKSSPITLKLDVPSCFSKPQELKERDTSSKILSHHVKKEPYSDFDAPGFSRFLDASGPSRPITSVASDKGSIAVTNLRTLPVPCKEDAPPGFCKSIKLEGKISSI